MEIKQAELAVEDHRESSPRAPDSVIDASLTPPLQEFTSSEGSDDESPDCKPTTISTTPRIQLHDDFSELRRKLHAISNDHYHALWQEKGPMWAALGNNYSGKQKFEEFRPDIKLTNQDGTPTERLVNFTRAFIHANIHDLPLRMSGTQTEIEPLNQLLTFVIDSLMKLMADCVDQKPSEFLDHEQQQSLKALYNGLRGNKSISTTELRDIQVAYIPKILDVMKPKQLEKFYGNLAQQKPDLFAHYDFDDVRFRTTRSAIVLRTDKKHSKKSPDFAYLQLAALYEGREDDFSLFNEAYGHAFAFRDGSQKGFSIHNTSYHVNNGVINVVKNGLADPNDLNRESENHRWEALVTLNNATTVLNKTVNPDSDSVYPVSDIAIIYSWLESVNEPLHFLRPHAECAAITANITSLYSKSYDEVYKFLYFNKAHQQSLATYLGIQLPKQGLGYIDFLKQVASKKQLRNSSIYKQKLAEIIDNFAQGQLNHVGFQAELKKLLTEYKAPYFTGHSQHHLAAFLKINLTKSVNNQSVPIDYPDFLTEILIKCNQRIPRYKRALADIVYRFEHGKLKHNAFQNELSQLSSQYRPSSFFTRLIHSLIAIVTPGWGKFAALQQQYDDIKHLNTVILPGCADVRQQEEEVEQLRSVIHEFKEIQSQCNADLAKAAVNDKLAVAPLSGKVTVNSIRAQNKDKIIDLHWLNDQEKERVDRIAQSDLSSSLQVMQTRETVREQVKQQPNPVYASAFSKLLFTAHLQSTSKPTVPRLKAGTPQLDRLVKVTTEAHQRIHSSTNKPATVPATTEITQSLLMASIAAGRQLECKAQVRERLVRETLSDERSVLARAF